MGLYMLSWKALDPQKPEKTNGFLRFLVLYVFGTLGLLMALLGSSWLLLGRFGPKMAPKMGPQMASNRPNKGHLGEQEAQAQPARAI